MAQDAEDRPGYQIKRAQSLFRTTADRRLRDHGLTMAGYAVLRALADEPGISAANLARRVFVTRQTLGGVVSGLVEQGWVDQHAPNPRTGGRVRPLTISRSGRRTLSRAERIVTGVEEAALANLTREETTELARLLAAYADNLSR